MSFIESLEGATNVGHTENGAVSNQSTLDPVLEFFSKSGALRGDVKKARELFRKAYASDPELALKALFYLRDVRGGAGERKLFRSIFAHEVSEDHQRALVRLVPEYGRFDDFDLVKFSDVIDEQLAADNVAKHPSLLAKWLPSMNATSKATRSRAHNLARALSLEPREYRQLISRLRGKIRLLEQDMSERNWSNIEYDKLPSQALMRHTKAFQRHDAERFAKYLEDVKSGKKKINASTLYAHELYRMVKSGEAADTADVLWEALPDYTNGDNALVIADVSGSMMSGLSSVAPMDISVSLALYFADKNVGTFKDYFMTFSEQPALQKVRGRTLREKFNSIERADWGMSTDLQLAFDAILTAAIDDNTPQEEMPSTLYIISDMQFNQASRGNTKTNLETARDKFESNGYKLPQIVFWNVNARGNDSPATKYDEGVTLVSGTSQSVFQFVFSGLSPIQSMMMVLGSERYDPIEI